MNKKYFIPALLFACGFAAGVRCEPVDVRVLYQNGYVAVKMAALDGYTELDGNDFFMDEGDCLKVGEDSQAGLLIDGETLMQVEQNSELLIQKSGEDKGDIFVKSGDINTRFGPVSGGAGKFCIRTNTAMLGIRGTEIALSAFEGNTDIAVFSGVVDVDYFTQEGAVSGEEIKLEEGMQTAVYYRSPPLKPFAMKDAMIKRKAKIMELRKKLPVLRKKYKKMHFADRAKKRNELLKKVMKRRSKRNKNIRK